MQEKKPDLTNFKNIFNYVIYGLAGIVSVLYFSSARKDDKIADNLQKNLDECNEESKEYRKNNQKLIDKAYDLKQENLAKDTMLKKSAEAFDSIAVENLKEQAEPYIKNLKKYTK